MTKLYRYKLQQIYNAFKSDAQMLLLEFQKLQSYKFQDFSSIWRKYKFSLIYQREESSRDLITFATITFPILKKIFLNSEEVFTRLGAFFLLYGVYYKQPITEKNCIRLTINEYKSLKQFTEELAESEQYDAAFIFAKMKQESVFHFVYMETKLMPEVKPVTSQLNKQSWNSDQLKLASLHDNFNSLVNTKLTEINNIDVEYKASINNLLAMFPDFAFDSFDTDPLKEVKTYLETPESGPSTTKDTEDLGEKRKSLKNKASTVQTVPRKSLTGKGVKRKASS